jgi:DNA polymerase (family X)
MENPEVDGLFEEVADLLELQDANPFRVRAYRNAARTIRDLPEPLAGRSVKEIDALPGIGADLAGKIKTALDTGDLPLRRELRGQVPAGVRDFIAVPGVGPKRARALHDRLHVNSVAGLRRAAEQHRIRKLPGFGAKTEEHILHAREGHEEAGRRVLLAEAKVFADAVVRYLGRAPEVGRVEVAGSFRRRKETVGDLDLLATCARPGPARSWTGWRLTRRWPRWWPAGRRR